MACLINDIIALDCINGLGGVKEMYVFAGDWEADVVVTEVAGEATAITGTGTFYQFYLPKDTASFTESINVSNVNGTVYYQPELSAVFQKMDAAKRNQILLLAQNRALRVVFVDNNDVSWVMGNKRGCVMSAGTSATGTAVGDLNAYSITLQGQEPQSVLPILVGDTLADIIGGGITIVTS
jgi:hypothetical protein